jgi:hypothetical protein
MITAFTIEALELSKAYFGSRLESYRRYGKILNGRPRFCFNRKGNS